MLLLGWQLWCFRIEKSIDEKGVNVPAIITSVTFGHGDNFDFTYLYKGKRYEKSANLNSCHCQKGDSVLIRIMSDNPDGGLMNYEVKEKIYSIKNGRHASLKY